MPIRAAYRTRSNARGTFAAAAARISSCVASCSSVSEMTTVTPSVPKMPAEPLPQSPHSASISADGAHVVCGDSDGKETQREQNRPCHLIDKGQ